MRYYKMAISWDPSVKGIRDGSAQVEFDKKLVVDKDALDKVQAFFTWSREYTRVYPPNFDVKIEGFKLRKKGLLTDFLDYQPFYADCPFMVNDKVLKLLSRFNLAEHYYYPLTIATDKGIVSGYQLFNIPFTDVSIIDFPKSKFSSGYEISNNLKEHTFESFEDMQDKRESSLTPKHIVLGEKFDKSLDLFEIRIGGLMVSERLKNAIEQAGLTGVTIYEGKPGPLVEVLD